MTHLTLYLTAIEAMNIKTTDGSTTYFTKTYVRTGGFVKLEENLKHVTQCAVKCQRTNNCQFFQFEKNETQTNNLCKIWRT